MSVVQRDNASAKIPAKFKGPTDAIRSGVVKELPNLKTVNDIHMSLIGNPSTAILVGVPPSLPLFVKKNSVISIQAKPESIDVALKYRQPLKNFFLGNFASSYQRLIGVEPFTVLVSSETPPYFSKLFSRRLSRSFALLSLDGAKDWAILKRNGLQAYSGPSLKIDIHILPKRVSRQLSKHLSIPSRLPTGLQSWLTRGFTFIQGRGSVGIVGDGTIFQSELSEGEEVLVKRSALLGLSVNGPHELQNCIAGFAFNDSPINIRLQPPPAPAHISSFKELMAQFRHYYHQGASVFKKAFRFAIELQNNDEFLRVLGPRTLLLQSTLHGTSFERKFNLPSLKSSTQVEILPDEIENNTPKDYLNVVVVDPSNGVTIKSIDTLVDGNKRSHS